MGDLCTCSRGPPWPAAPITGPRPLAYGDSNFVSPAPIPRSIPRLPLPSRPPRSPPRTSIEAPARLSQGHHQLGLGSAVLEHPAAFFIGLAGSGILLQKVPRPRFAREHIFQEKVLQRCGDYKRQPPLGLSVRESEVGFPGRQQIKLIQFCFAHNSLLGHFFQCDT